MKTYKEWLEGNVQYDPEDVMDDVEQQWLRRNKGSSATDSKSSIFGNSSPVIKKSTDIGGSPNSSTVKNKIKPINFGLQTTIIQKPVSGIS